ncbi:hypothetical protein SteCoe_5855 [Stentor coeruleus]|uniref:DOMON domain-containing protein n=1 Tax=Stentor coeruleus TaxID=5963 RepID=A0A1R2CRG1_9CILI|nr:hypothetical protein SteCoe_5855 [Stentor coeruleus]
MNKCVFVITLIALSAHGMVEYLPRGMQMKYFFPAEDEVKFEWWIPMSVIDPYDWIGFAIQDVKWARNSFEADYYILVRSEQKYQDYFLDHEGNPVSDELLGGTSDILETLTIQYGSHMIYSLHRKLVTGDLFDTDLVKERPYMLKWALGVMNDGEVAQHAMLDIGFEYFVLSELYEDRNHDEMTVYGPFVNYPPEYNNPPPERKPENFEWSMMVEDYFMGEVFDPETFYISDPEGEPAIILAAP